MIIIVKWLPRMGINGIALFPFIFVRDKDPYLVNHERIHLHQQLRWWIIPFYFKYLFELFTKGYWSISFEKEAYCNEKDLSYLRKKKQ